LAESGLINEVYTSQKAVAITFDDGPNPIYTPQVLKIFAEAKGKATFFMIGEQINASPEITKAVADQGHEIGNHTYTHAKLSELNTADCLDEIERNERLIQELIGKKPRILRPPYLDYNQETISITGQKGYPLIGALNMEAHDWEQPGVDHILSVSRNCIKNGSILIFHDGYGDRTQTIEAVRVLVTELNSKGYQLVTVSELLEQAD